MSWVAPSSTEEHVSVGNPYFKRAFLIGYGSTHQPFIFIKGHALRLAILQTGDFARTSSNWEGKWEARENRVRFISLLIYYGTVFPIKYINLPAGACDLNTQEAEAGGLLLLWGIVSSMPDPTSKQKHKHTGYLCDMYVPKLFTSLGTEGLIPVIQNPHTEADLRGIGSRVKLPSGAGPMTCLPLARLQSWLSP